MKSQIQETSLNRLVSKMDLHDTGTITAYRSKYTKKENQQRNRSLLAKLQNLRYRVTSVRGSYIENYGTPNAIEVGEHVFFVEDWLDKGKLEKDLRKLGEEFTQDSVLFIPKPGNKAYLWGTNIEDKEAFPGYSKVKEYPNREIGREGVFMTRVSGRPFFFKKVVKEHPGPSNSLGKWGCNTYAKMDWREMDIVEEWNEKFKFTKKKFSENWLSKWGWK